MTELDLVTVKRAAEILKCHPVSVRRMIRAGDLPAMRVRREWRVPLEALRPVRHGGAR